MRTKLFHGKSTCDVDCMKKIKFGAKYGLYFLHGTQKNWFSAEVYMRANIAEMSVHFFIIF
jgi:hypothetical protein